MVIEQLTRPLAEARVEEIAALLARIPGYAPSADEVLAEEKRGLPLQAKWELSLVALDEAGVAGVAILYRRAAEPPLYPAPTVYKNGLAVRADVEGTGLGGALFDKSLDVADQWVSRHEPGIRCSLQTNSAPFNERARKMYERRGFTVLGEKAYDNRTDVVMLR